MAYYYEDLSRTFSEYLLIPGYSSSQCIPQNVSLKTPLVKYRKGQEECPLTLNIPMVSAIMQAVSGEKMGQALAREGGLAFIYGSQSVEDEARMVARVKSYKAGFVVSDSNIKPDATLNDILALTKRTGHSTIAVTDNGECDGKLLGVVTSRDYRISRMSGDEKVESFMTPFSKLIMGKEGITLSQANDIIWEHKLNQLPVVTEDGHLVAFVFRKDYSIHKENPNELLDQYKRYIIGAGINTRDYEERVPALVEAGVDVLCIDSSEGFSEWQQRTLSWIREKYGDRVKQICDYALQNQLEAVACDMSKTITESLDKNTIHPNKQPFIDTAFEKLFFWQPKRIKIPVYSDEERPLIEIIRSFWNGDFQ